MIVTLLDNAISLTIFTVKTGWNLSKYIYSLFQEKQKSDYEKFVEFMDKRDIEMSEITKY